MRYGLQALTARRIGGYGFALTLSALACLVPHGSEAAGPPPPPVPTVQFDKPWQPQGPTVTQNGQVEGATVANGAVVGALHSVAAHPTNADILHVGAVNGGIWRTTNATAANPAWTPVVSQAGPLAVAALEYDPTDALHNTLLAGNGYMSSYFQGTTTLPGLLRSVDGGLTWAGITHAVLQGENIICVAARGSTLLAGSNARAHLNASFAPPLVPIGVGRLMRSTDTGVNWVTISGGGGTGLPAGPIFDIAGDPLATTRLYSSVQATGIFRTTDTGATWTNISAGDATLNAEITNAGNNNCELSVGPTGRVWAAVVRNGQVRYIGYTDNPTIAVPTWTQMDLPLTLESNAQIEGLNPREKPGSQGGTHLSIVADPTLSNIVYVGGDRQDGPFPNAIGANDFSGRLFRGDSTQAPTGGTFSPQWDHLTHTQNVGFAGGGTAAGSAPHADSREMVFSTDGSLIEVDDGGVYRRTSPQDNTGDWFSLIGTNLQVTEAHDVAYDPVQQIFTTGNQDTGTGRQTAPGSTTWGSVPITFPGVPFSTGDGGDVNVDGVNPAGGSTHYSSFQNLGLWRRQAYNGAFVLQTETYPALTGAVGGVQFKTPVELNRINPLRLIVGGSDAWESLNQGNTATNLGIGQVNRPGAIAYGGTSGGVPNPDVLYVGSGASVFVRTVAPPTAAAASATYPGGFVRDIALNPLDWNDAFVVDPVGVYQTLDAGATWTNISGNLAAVGGLDPMSVEYVSAPGGDVVLVGTRNGVFGAAVGVPGTWAQLGTGLPSARVWELNYDAPSDLLYATTMGRGVFTISQLTVSSDVVPPTLSVSLQRDLLWMPRNGMLPIGLSVNASDDRPGPLTVVVSVYSDEPDGAAPYSPDALGTSPASTRLRAERAFPGDGRVYLLVVEAFDVAGNRSFECRSSVVPTMPTTASILGARTQASNAEAFCVGNSGAAPGGYSLLLCYSYAVP